MTKYNKNALKTQDTWLQIQFYVDISEHLGDTVPYPQHHFFNHQGFVTYCWLLDGFFHTRKNIEFLNDIIARFKITFEDCRFIKTQTVERSSTQQAYKLKQFQALKSRATNKVNERTRADASADYVFYCIKFYAEDLIREKTIFTQDELEEFAELNFINKAKDRSTLKAKCRNIYNWYLDRNFEIPKSKYIKISKEQVMATRLAHINKVNEQRKKESKAKIQIAITGLQAEEYFKKKNGTWNAKAIAEYTKQDVRTVRKYLKELN